MWCFVYRWAIWSCTGRCAVAACSPGSCRWQGHVLRSRSPWRHTARPSLLPWRWSCGVGHRDIEQHRSLCPTPDWRYQPDRWRRRKGVNTTEQMLLTNNFTNSTLLIQAYWYKDHQQINQLTKLFIEHKSWTICWFHRFKCVDLMLFSVLHHVNRKSWDFGLLVAQNKRNVDLI